MSENNERQGNDTREQELGALWQKQGAKGVYFTGSISLDGGTTKQRIVVFANNHKKSENHPDFRILKSDGERRSTGSAPRRQDDEGYGPGCPVDPEPITDEDIPF